MNHSGKRTLLRFIPYYKPHIGMLTLDMLCSAFLVVCDIILPIIVGQLTDMAVSDLSSLTPRYITGIALFYLFMRLLDVGANFFVSSNGHIIGAKMETAMRRDMFAHLQKLPFGYYANTKIGQLMSRITTDLFDITEFAHHCPEMIFTAGLKITVAFCILCTYNLWLALAILASIPIMLIIHKLFKNRMRAAFALQRSQLGEMNARVEDSLLGIRVVKSFGNEKIENEKFARDNAKFLGIKANAYYAMAGFHSMTRCFDGLMYLLVVVLGVVLLTHNQLSIGDFTSSLLFVSTVLGSIRSLVDFSESLQRGITSIDRFFEVLDEQPEEDDPDAVDLPSVRGNITLEHVTFHYEDNATEVLHDICVDIPAGSSYALVGPSGGGKTTLCNLIPRFYNLDSGKICIDGVDIRKITRESLRRHIGIVQQDVYLFSGTIRENILYGRPDATEEEVVAAAKRACADEFIREFPDGYDTYIGERGVKLSGGQKQRISIARVFLKNPPILLLDEATSALDNESERIIQRSLEELSQGRTTLTIAHRLSTIRDADEIIVLSKNGIEEQGNHQTLLEKKGMYARMTNFAEYSAANP